MGNDRTLIDPATVPLAEIPAALERLDTARTALLLRLLVPTPHPPATAARLLTAEEVAERLAMTEARIYEMARTGELPSVLIGRLRRFEPEAIARWIEARRSGRK